MYLCINVPLFVCQCECCILVSLSPQVILGVTNPFFAKALDHWPHIIKAGDHTSSIANGAGEGCVCLYILVFQ